ncbi:hypothetical protein BLKGLAD_59310 [Burkholderia gladioli pv. gladioli]
MLVLPLPLVKSAAVAPAARGRAEAPQLNNAEVTR